MRGIAFVVALAGVLGLAATCGGNDEEKQPTKAPTVVAAAATFTSVPVAATDTAVPPTSAPPRPTSTPVRPTVACNPNYSGACLDKPGDYDCAGGSGNGPNYTGRVTVVGVDVYDLDRDGDGIGCE